MASNKSRKVLWLLLAAVLLLLLSGGTFLFLNQSDATREKVVADKVDKLEDPVSSEDNLKDTPIEGEESYRVDAGNITPKIENRDGAKAVKYFKAIAGANFAKYVDEIVLISDKDSDEDASVIVSDKDPQMWVLRINLGFLDERDGEENLIYGLVHEYAHILSLNDTQVDGFVSGECPALEISEGCANEDSYINQFERKFWSSLNADPDAEEFGGYYEGREEDFVTEYASTNAIEDFAETFAQYVLKDTTQFEGVAADKVQFMVDKPDIRDEVSRIRKAVKKL